MNELRLNTSVMAPADERDSDVDGGFALRNAPSIPSVDAERLTSGQLLLMQHVKHMTSFLG